MEGTLSVKPMLTPPRIRFGSSETSCLGVAKLWAVARGRLVARSSAVAPHVLLPAVAMTLDAETMVKKLSIDDKRKLMVAEKVWVYKSPGLLKEYDPIESTKPENVGMTALNMPLDMLNDYALKAAEKRLARGETSLVSVARLE